MSTLFDEAKMKDFQNDIKSIHNRLTAVEKEVHMLWKLEYQVHSLEADVKRLQSEVHLLQEAAGLQIVPVMDTKLQDTVRIFGVRGKPFRKEEFYSFLGGQAKFLGMDLTLVDRRLFERSFDRLVRQKFISQRRGWYRLGGM